jgi:hypothetical protein
MAELRRPFLIAAFVLSVLVVLIEVGTGLPTILSNFIHIGSPPGLGIPYLVLVDGVLAYTLGLMVVSLVVPERVIGRLQGCVTLIVSVVVLLGSIVLVFIAITLLLLMIGLLASFFGAVIYFAVFADFPRDAAALILGTLLTLKVVLAACLVLAHQRFLENKGLVILVILSLVLNLVIAFLHDLLPGFLTSITDAVAAIIVAIVAIIWSVLLLIGAVIAVLRVIRPPQPLGKQDEAVSRGSAPGMTTRSSG